MKRTKDSVNQFVFIFVVFIIGVIVGRQYFAKPESNSRLLYGETGYPKNCRAIIKANYEGWYLNQYSASEALGSINRNCGEFGYSW